jgi:hypothetical protein
MRKEEKKEVLVSILSGKHSSSSPSPVRKHKRRTGVDELQGK